MSKRVFTVNVGANASHAPKGLKSPISHDHSFEFIPVPAEERLPGYLTFDQLHSFNNPEEKLLKYIPEKYHKEQAHNDPDFVNMTYGDFCDEFPRAAALRQITRGDFILFWARLYSQGKGNLYLIGLFEVEQVFPKIDRQSLGKMPKHARQNPHAQAIIAGDYRHSSWLFVGSKNSVRFKYAVPLEWGWTSEVFRDRNDLPWERKNGNLSTQQRIAMYMRSCRCQIDLNRPEHRKRAQRLQEEMLRFNPDVPIALV